jgi:LPXTG-motif cell wall-anchored protein
LPRTGVYGVNTPSWLGILGLVLLTTGLAIVWKGRRSH